MNKPVLRLFYLILELVQENLLGKYPLLTDTIGNDFEPSIYLFQVESTIQTKQHSD